MKFDEFKLPIESQYYCYYHYVIAQNELATKYGRTEILIQTNAKKFRIKNYKTCYIQCRQENF